MRQLSFLLFLPLSNLVAACGSSGSGSAGSPMTIHISSGIAPALVAVRDGDAPWTPATMTTPTRFEATVHGPYLVTVVCENVIKHIELPDVMSDTWMTWQAGRTPDDSPELSGPCDVQPTQYVVTGHMAQAGRIQLQDSPQSSSIAGWSFDLVVDDGTYDLYASTPDLLATRRGLVINANTAVTPMIDVATEGKPLSPVAFTITNASAGATLLASVGIQAANTIVPAQLYLGGIDAAKAAPDALLLPSENQTASLRVLSMSAVSNVMTATTRALRRPFRIGGDTRFTLPDAIGAPTWKVENDQVTASWSSLPDAHPLSMDVSGASSDPKKASDQSLDLSTAYLTETGLTHVTIDLAIPGYQPAWTVNVATIPYYRELFAQQVSDGVISTTSISDFVDPLAHARRGPPGVTAETAPPAPRSHQATARHRAM